MRLGPARRPRARISLIPLIDVMLVLLFFFMLVTSYVRIDRTPLELADGGRGGSPGLSEADSATVLDDGQLLYRGETRTLDAWLPSLRTLPAGQELRLHAAPGLPLQALLAAWQRLREQRIAVRLATGPQ